MNAEASAGVHTNLLVLGGQEDRVERGRAGLRTIGGAEAVTRLAKVQNVKPPTQLAAASLTWDGGRASSECRELLSAGVTYIDSLVPALAKEPVWFWENHYETGKNLVETALSELKLRYEAKIRRAQETYREVWTAALNDTGYGVTRT